VGSRIVPVTMQVYRVPFSTNCERVALALAHKGLEVEWVDVPADDRSAVVAVSGQPLVPVLVDGDDVITDSPVILRHLEHCFPEPRLYPADPARNAEAEIFVAWFNSVWKRPPNQIADELVRDGPDRVAIAEWGAQLTGSLPLFEALLDGRDYLLGDRFGIADVTAFPFLKYATLWEEGDPDLFHRVLRDHLAVGGHERLAAWIERVDALPRA
jgi:glutathione S-transferase